ncbi:aminoglycoside 3'-phosphotransferase/choline kinase family protein [Actinoallomurus purpureus]|uniref:phosphotransferase family protein n=1 Tax=Actinoallomurus purpureus TaxID=478114 RepID=UPI0020933028|nr:aminoglycoside 3'-phosphotransferase/choline kinase family protein [Actinoallomurus purpureus]MCO6008659.1 aminoglycoside 3'-phosphotransferase/choline kinase family protein [Actinoallomurus purpureus]
MPNDSLPAAATEAQFATVRRDEARLRPGVLALCRRLGRSGADVTRFPDGSLPVYAVGDRLVLKLYPPIARERGQIEERVLRTIDGRLPVPTPRVEEAGGFGTWRYLLMTRLRGEPLTEVWPRTGERDRDRLAAQLGTALAALHEIPVRALGPPDWQGFLAGQRVDCVERQRARGLDPEWAAQIPEFLDSVPLPPSSPVLLHTEVMREHLLVAPGPDGGWSLSGLYDFEPAMMGDREYEFVSVGLFVSRGDPRFLRHLLTAYGYSGDRLDATLQRRLLAYALLHRYSDLSWYLEEMPEPPVPKLDALAARWWPLDAP